MSREEIKLPLEPFGAAETVLTTTKLGVTRLACPRRGPSPSSGATWTERAAGRGKVATVVLPMGNRSTS